MSFSPFCKLLFRKNYLLFLNLENSPCIRPARLKYLEVLIFKSKFSSQLCLVIQLLDFLDHLGFQPDDLVIIASTDISGIPLFFSASEDHLFMSLEHTHPPASYVIHGNRWAAQKLLKNRWFTKLNLS